MVFSTTLKGEVKLMDAMEAIDWIAKILVIVGGLNWGLYAFGYNLVSLVFGSIPMLETIVYVLVAISALYMLYDLFAKK
jgi:uncharacterized protein